MKLGDTIIYLWNPHKNKPIVSISVATLTREENKSMFDKDPAFKPIKRLFGEGGTHEQQAKSFYLYDIGNPEVIRKIFTLGVER